MTKDTQVIGLSRALRNLQSAEKELRRLGADDFEVSRVRIEVTELTRRVAALLAQKM